MKTKIIINSLILIFLLGLITAEENTSCILCKEQLQITLDMYNNCSYDYSQGYNCGTLTDLLKNNNKKLSDGLHTCQRNKIIYPIITTIFILVLIWDIVERRKRK